MKDPHLVPTKSHCTGEWRSPLDMPNTIPLASAWILLGEYGYPDGHPIRGVFELELQNIFFSQDPQEVNEPQTR